MQTEDVLLEGEGTLHTPDRVVDANGNVIAKSMIVVERDGKQVVTYLSAEEAAIVLVALGVVPYAQY